MPVERERAGNELGEGVDDTCVITRDSVIDDFFDRAAPVRDDRRAASHRFDHDEAKRLVPLNGKEQRSGMPQQLVFLCMTDRPNPAYTLAIDQRFYLFGEVKALVAFCGCPARIRGMSTACAMRMASSGFLLGPIRPR